MADNSRKTPLAATLPAAVRRQIGDVLQLTGYALPCYVKAVAGAIVTVAFDIVTDRTLPDVTIPILESRYVRLPIQVNDTGVVVPADAYLGGVSGMGGGTASLLQPGNLSALAFLPIGNKNWPEVDSNATNITGPNGAVIKADTGSANFTLTPDGISMSAGGHTVVINSSGVTIDGKVFLGHEHSGVTSGSSNTGGVV